MLFSKNFMMNNKEYEMKVNVRTLLNLKKNKINISSPEELSDVETIFKVVSIACNVKFDEFVDEFDESDLTIEDLSKIMTEAIDLGINKGKKTVSIDDAIDSTEEIKNS